MKKVLASVLAVGCLAAAGSAFAGLPAGTGVNGSLHDMSTLVGTNADVMGRVCVYCHTPHHAQKDARNAGAGANDDYPLWNHAFGTAALTQYTWATPNNQAAVISDALAGPSRLCMSCHDGSVGVDEHGGTQTFAGTVSNKMGNLGGSAGAKIDDLSTTHPIGFDYNAIATARNNNSNGGVMAAGATVGSEIAVSTNHYATAITTSSTPGQYNKVDRATAGKTIADNLFGGSIMTCATCHEVHNKENATQDNFINGGTGITGAAPNYFLYAKETSSLICLSCHVK